MQNIKDRAWFIIFFAWLVSVIATLGSLFFSEIMKFPPCVLCWYQRIAMYPLVVILLAGLFPLEKNIMRLTLPLTFIGWGIAFYHNLLYYKWIPKSASPCVQGISCTSVHIEWFGFVTIPLLSLIAFSIIIFLQIFTIRMLKNEK